MIVGQVRFMRYQIGKILKMSGELIANLTSIGLTVIGVVIAMFLVRWLDRNVFSKHKRIKK